MSETPAIDRQLSIQRVYIKDVSLETPNSPQIFRDNISPEVNFNLGTEAQPLDTDVFEVVLTVTVTVKAGEKVAYLIEVKQAGIFTLKNFARPELGHLLGSFCPNTLYPYACELVSSLVLKAGFPQLLLAPVNFEALYAEHLKQQAQQRPAPTALN